MNEAELNDLIARAKSTATLNYTKGYDFMIETYDWSDWADLVNDHQTWGKIYNEMKKRVKDEKQRIKVGRENSDADAEIIKPVSRQTKNKKDAELLAIARQRALETAQAKKENAEEDRKRMTAISGGIDPARTCPTETREQGKAAKAPRSGTSVPTPERAPKGSTSASPGARNTRVPFGEATIFHKESDVKVYSSIAEAEADEDLAEEEVETDTRVCLANQIKKYVPTYIISATHNGTKSKICGDAVSKLFEGKSLGEVFSICEAHLNINLRTRWLHLNVGQQRMCAGNMLRAAIKRGDVTLDDKLGGSIVTGAL
jgi:hypothetical protein